MIAVASLLASGCSTFTAPDYGVSIENVAFIERIEASGSVSVGEFDTAEGVPDKITCRGAGPVTASPGKTYAQYIRDALHDELYLARVIDQDSSVQITGRLNAIDFSSTSPAHWDLNVTVMAPGRSDITVDVSLPFNTSWDALSACRDASGAFEAAVEQVVREIVTHQDFPSYLNP
jgi:hypothetical protein